MIHQQEEVTSCKVTSKLQVLAIMTTFILAAAVTTTVGVLIYAALVPNVSCVPTTRQPADYEETIHMVSLAQKLLSYGKTNKLTV